MFDLTRERNVVQKEAVNTRVQNEFGWFGGSCVQLDLLIKKVRDKIVEERLKPSSYNYGLSQGFPVSIELYIDALVQQKSTLEYLFISNKCADKIETLRQKESAVLVTKQAIEQEKAVLKPANTEQRIYIVGGAVILLVGLLILVKK